MILDDDWTPQFDDNGLTPEDYQAEQEAGLESTAVELPQAQYIEHRAAVPERTVGTQMAEARRRLAKATYYNELLNGTIFTGEDDLSLEVENEIKEFVYNQLMILTGVGLPDRVETQPVVAAQFSEDEATILRAVVARVLKSSKPQQSPKATQMSKPAVNVKSPPPPAAKVAPRPQLRQRELPAGAPVARPALPTSPNRPNQELPVQSLPKSPSPNLPGPPAEGEVPKNGLIYQAHGKTFRVQWRQINDESQAGPGVQIAKNSRGIYKVIHMDVTPKQSATDQKGGVPFPSSNAQFSAISLQKAAQAEAIRARTGGMIDSTDSNIQSQF